MPGGRVGRIDSSEAGYRTLRLCSLDSRTYIDAMPPSAAGAA
uniref:Uncharacterized protein n=1 Tax=Chromobacterium violaceum TaxID=536 RepID=A0A2R4K2M0_CHRVL|nr:hypothetical protein [Chromobacterium violaceum]